MAINIRTLLVGLGFVFSAAVNANPSILTGELEAQQVGDCIAWYLPQLRGPPETCNDVVNMHPGLDLTTFLMLNPAIHPYCDNMQVGHRVCIRTIQQNDCPNLAEPSSQPQATSPSQWKTSTTPTPQETSSMASHRWH